MSWLQWTPLFVAVAAGATMVLFRIRKGRPPRSLLDETPITIEAVQERLDFAKASGKNITTIEALDEVLDEGRLAKTARRSHPHKPDESDHG